MKPMNMRPLRAIGALAALVKSDHLRFAALFRFVLNFERCLSQV
jgi:hypothetical protein